MEKIDISTAAYQMQICESSRVGASNTNIDGPFSSPALL